MTMVRFDTDLGRSIIKAIKTIAMDKFSIKSTSKTSADVLTDIVLSESQTTRRIFRPQIVKKPNSSECLIKGWIVHQRKSTKGSWEDSKSIDLNTLKSGEGVKLELDSEQMKRLIEALDQLKAIADQSGITYGHKNFVVADEKSVIVIPDARRRAVIQKLVEQDSGEEFWQVLASSKPDLAKRLSYSQIQLDRENALRQFDTHLKSKDWSEAQWEEFFYKNQWIFGYGLRYQFLGILRRQANYGAATFERTGEQKGEFLTKSIGNQKFTVVVEIKKPQTEIFEPAKPDYRSGVPTFTAEFIQAVSQVQVNARTWDTEGSKRERDREQLAKESTNTITPRSILIIGDTSRLDTFDKRNSFELFRTNAHNPDIITFDELFERAKYIVGTDNSLKGRQK